MAKGNKAKTDRSYEQLVENFVKWAETRPDIRAAVILGSRARVDRLADEWADLDITMVASNPERCLSTTDWLVSIGNPLITFLEPTATGGEMERRILFDDLLDVDLSIISEKTVQQLLQERMPPQIAAEIANAFGRGARVLLDKDGIAAQLRALIGSIETPSSRPPTQHEFLEVANDFLYHAVWTAKKLMRGELRTAKSCLDSYMKWKCLLRMIEWHAQATHGWSYDTWFRGRFLEEWADPRVLEALRGAFAYYDKEDIKRALLATMELFRWMAMETAERFRYPYPTKADRTVTEWIRNLHLERGAESCDESE